MAKGRGTGGTPSAGRLLGSGSKGRQGGNVQGIRGTPQQIDMLQPHLSGNPDVVAQRTNEATKGTMLKKQLKSNKSKGMSARKGKVS